MHIEAFRAYCLSKKGATESFPFDNQILAFKVGGKLFALTDVDFFESINLKCDPERALELRASYMSVQPGYHMNKKHWNTIENQGDVSDTLLYELIDHSYALVFEKLPKRVQQALQ